MAPDPARIFLMTAACLRELPSTQPTVRSKAFNRTVRETPGAREELVSTELSAGISLFERSSAHKNSSVRSIQDV
jgi:hypothetical protein